MLTHLDESGNAIMVNISAKEITRRIALAQGFIRMNGAAFEALEGKTAKKGDVLAAARIAGIMAAKRTPELIPLCHQVPLNSVKVDFVFHNENKALQAICTTECLGRTGVEMEALTGVSIALLTVYDMLKALDKAMVIDSVCVLEKQGGQRGDYRRGEAHA